MSSTPMKFVKRNPIFLESGVLRFDATDIASLKEIGNQLGKMISRTFDGEKPLKEVFLYGGYCSGKSSLSNFILEGFDNSEGCSILRQTKMQRIAKTHPRCFHIDYRLHSGNPLVWKMIPEYRIPKIASDEILIGEWCDYLTEDYFHPDRIMIEIVSAKTIQDALAKNEYAAPATKAQLAMINFINKMPRARVMSLVGFGIGKNIIDGLAEFMQGKVMKLEGGR